MASKRLDRFPFWLLLPTFIITFSLVLYPLAESLRLSLTDFRIGPPFSHYVGLENFIAVLTSVNTYRSILVTFIYSFSSTCISLVLGLVAALVLNRSFFGRKAVTTLFLLPMMISSVAVAMMWLLIYEPGFGPVQWLAEVIFKQKNFAPLARMPGALISVIITDVWQWTPFMILIALAGLRALPRELHEAAVVDGATGTQVFFHISLPMIRPVILIGFFLRLIDSFRTFDILFLMTGGGPGTSTENLSLFVYRTGLKNLNIGRASAISYVFLVIVIIMITFMLRFLRASKQQIGG